MSSATQLLHSSEKRLNVSVGSSSRIIFEAFECSQSLDCLMTASDVSGFASWNPLLYQLPSKPDLRSRAPKRQPNM
ncbi:hypothetical protein L596_023674 [Steinernema carpocapsae]|uniref:Uncharacterized protein n=1 Tax=Steinernema carpocapsae TaxID=34508 RepID=A0A4U5MF45_STECR|nr:hypothetical protein L596_023674 [Steinernema carpocapsae]